MKDYYQLLGVAQNATAHDISKAYHVQALRHHPDTSGENGERMREINEAYAVLSDPARRMIYDTQILGFTGLAELNSLSSGCFNPHRKNHLKAMLMNRKAGLRHMPFLMEAIAQGDPETCFAIKTLLVCYGRLAAVYLQAYLCHSQERVRYFALLAINEIEYWPPENRLVSLLRDSSARIRIEVIHALAASKAQGAIPYLKKIMSDEVMSVRLSVIEALKTLGGALAAEAICTGLQDNEARVRKEAATALGHLGQLE
ncbi:MAG: DnaJ domain-containing protein, partial [Deltaproteobacteria bacterium]|nr:DnaJ domain-containing protein [Deltaproteobacteria bacterium]